MIAVRLYRLLPKDHRLRLIRLLPPHRQLWLVRRLTRQRPRGAAAQVGEVIRATDAGRRVWARVVAHMTPADAWQHNLDAVTAVLDREGIDYFCVPTLDSVRSVVAIKQTDGGQTVAALRSAPELRGAEIRCGEIDDGGFRERRGLRNGAQVYFPFTDRRAATVYGSGSACEIEFWRTVPGTNGAPDTLVGPRRNRVTTALPLHGESEYVRPRLLSGIMPVSPERARYRTRAEFAAVPPDDVRFPIDAVFTWVDGNDPDWLERKNAALVALGRQQINDISTNQSRFISRDELKYTLRSVVAFAPWIRRIFLVTDDQVPPWLDDSDPRLTVVSHRELFGGTGLLPTFNSHAIESRLHRIPGLAEHFIYFNDDMFLGRPVLPTTFFHANGIAKFFLSSAQIDAGPATIYDAPVTAAGNNNRRHILDRFGRGIAQKMQHVPYPLQRSVLEEIEETLPDQVLQTAAHPFRHPEDLSIPSSLQHYWAYLTRRAVPGTIKYTYADLAHPSTPMQLAFLLARRHCDVFCLNDTDSATVALAEQAAMMEDFLPQYFPFPSPFELPDEVAAERAAFSATQLARAAQAGMPVLPRQAARSTDATARHG